MESFYGLLLLLRSSLDQIVAMMELLIGIAHHRIIAWRLALQILSIWLFPAEFKGGVRVAVLIDVIIVRAGNGGSVIMKDDFMDLAKFPLYVFLSNWLFKTKFSVFGIGELLLCNIMFGNRPYHIKLIRLSYGSRGWDQHTWLLLKGFYLFAKGLLNFIWPWF